MQVMTKVHDDKYEPFGGNHAAFDPVTNLRVGVQVLKECIARAGSLEAGLRFYVGAANLADDGGYAGKVLAEQGTLRQVASGAQPCRPRRPRRSIPRRSRRHRPCRRRPRCRRGRQAGSAGRSGAARLAAADAAARPHRYTGGPRNWRWGVDREPEVEHHREARPASLSSASVSRSPGQPEPARTPCAHRDPCKGLPHVRPHPFHHRRRRPRDLGRRSSTRTGARKSTSS